MLKDLVHACRMIINQLELKQHLMCCQKSLLLFSVMLLVNKNLKSFITLQHILMWSWYVNYSVYF